MNDSDPLQQSTDGQDASVDAAVAAGGSYAALRQRLLDHGIALNDSANAINAQRIEAFGQVKSELLGRVRLRTENNCLPRDLVRIDDYLILGFNVFIGLKTDTKIEDVFAVFRAPTVTEEGIECEPTPIEGTLLNDAAFIRDFEELYRYNKNATLSQLRVKDSMFLAAFRIGEKVGDRRVFRWIKDDKTGRWVYHDNRGERDIELPNRYDFEWQHPSRDDYVMGDHPHIAIDQRLFVETVGGDLTIKVEDNTTTGQGIYAEPVDDDTQSLGDAEVAYSALGNLILLRIKPYRESVARYFVYNHLTQSVHRVDSMSDGCVQLPEDHGVICSQGIFLQDGTVKTFDRGSRSVRYRNTIKAPNGEDVLYVFFDVASGTFVLYLYNMIDKAVDSPIVCHGYALQDDGLMSVFSHESEEAARHHPLMVWQTAFCSDEYLHANVSDQQGFAERLGNAEMVRGIAELKGLIRHIEEESVSENRFALMLSETHRINDAFYWFREDECRGVSDQLTAIRHTVELVLEEYVKVQAIRQQAVQALSDAQSAQASIVADAGMSVSTVNEQMERLLKLRRHRGHLMTLTEQRYMDVPAIESMNGALDEIETQLT